MDYSQTCLPDEGGISANYVNSCAEILMKIPPSSGRQDWGVSLSISTEFCRGLLLCGHKWKACTSGEYILAVGFHGSQISSSLA